MSQTHAPHIERRSRPEIDRNYFFGDVFMQTAEAVGVAIVLIAAFTPFSAGRALAEGLYGYLVVLVLFGAAGLGLGLLGLHLRRCATHWERENV